MRALRLEAEADAWPLCSPAAFHAGLVSMVDKDAPTVLHQGLAERLARYGPSPFPSDPAAARWGVGTGADRPVTILGWLHRLARERLRIGGGVARLERPSEEPPGWAEVRWRFFTLRVPPEILLAALAAGEGMALTPARVDLLHPLLRSDQPTAHLHVHRAAIGSTARAWASLADPLKRLNMGAELPGAPGAGDPFTAGIRADQTGRPGGRLSWTEALRRAMWTEVMLAQFLDDAPQGSFETWAETRIKDAEQERALWELAMGRLHGAPPEREAEQRLTEAILAGFPRKPLFKPSRAAGQAAVNADPEVFTELLRSAMARLRRTSDVWLDRLVVQLVRVRCFFHQALVMDATTPGLQSFRRFDRRMTKLSPLAGPETWSSSTASGLRIEAVEVRFSPPRTLSSKLLDESAKASPEVGWVIHLSRSGDASNDACPWPAQGEFAAAQSDSLVDQAQKLQARDDRLLGTLRGLDLAGEETEGPLWLYAPILRDLRKRLDQQCAAAGVPGIRLTVHVGESFRHLASGLRAVHEPLLFGLTRDGDRLGHALALGLDPARWATRNARVWVRRWDRLLDLGWIQRAAASLGAGLDSGALLRIQEEERSLWRELYEWAPSGAASLGERHAGALHGALGRMELAHVRDLGSPRQPGASDDGLAALHLLCTRADAWRWAASLVPVDTAPEVRTLIAVRDALCRHIASRQLVIEVNPSSNLLIADLDHPLDQPMFHLRPIDPNERRGLPVCISADDPLTFATCFEDEVAYAWAGMVGSGQVPAAQARAWIEEALQVGWRARFTLPKAPVKRG